MKIQGTITKDSKSEYWIVEIPFLCLHTQGMSRKDALHMAKDSVEELLDHQTKVSVTEATDDYFHVGAQDTALLVAAAIKQRKGTSYREASLKIGSQSPNAVAQYALGKVSPGLDKLEELIQKLEDRDTEIVISTTSPKRKKS